MKMISPVLTLVAALALVSESEHNCIPKNNRYNPVGSKSINTVTEQEFNNSIDLAEAAYAPIFKEEYDATLIVERKWEDPTVNAYASQSGKIWKVAMFGGLARDPLVTIDGFTAVVCHEIGHHIAGAPRKVFSWASNEGQSDYFATAKCLKKIFEKDIANTIKLFRDGNITEDRLIAKKACIEAYGEIRGSAICYRSALAGESLAKLLGKLGGTPDIAFGTKDPSVVTSTNHNHPKGQCRMDTYFSGSICKKEGKPSETDVTAGYCTLKGGYETGVRPLCWYNPAEYEKDP